MVVRCDYSQTTRKRQYRLQSHVILFTHHDYIIKWVPCQGLVRVQGISVNGLCFPSADSYPYATSSVGSISTTCPADLPRGIIEPRRHNRRGSRDVRLRAPSVAEEVA